MTIAKYTPITEASSFDPITGELSPLPVALSERLVSNGQYNLRNRLRKSNMFWLGATTSVSGSVDNSEPDELLGYWNAGLSYLANGSAVADHDPQTYGLQFSTHIAEPYVLTIPVNTLFGGSEGGLQPRFRKGILESLKVRLSARIEEEDAQVLIWLARNDKAAGAEINLVKYGGLNNPADLINFPSATFGRSRFAGAGFKSSSELNTTDNGAVLLDLTKTSVSGSDGCSYYEVTIPSITLNPIDASTLSNPINYNTTDYSEESEDLINFEPVLAMAFLSKQGALMQGSSIRSFIDTNIQSSVFRGSGAFMTLNTPFTTLSEKITPNSPGDGPPGKFHAIAKVIYEADEGVPDGIGHTFHHVLQMFPMPGTPAVPEENYLFNPDLIDNPWDGTNFAAITIYPSIPYMPTDTQAPLVAATSGASTVELYYLSRITLFSVTIEPNLEDMP